MTPRQVSFAHQPRHHPVPRGRTTAVYCFLIFLIFRFSASSTTSNESGLFSLTFLLLVSMGFVLWLRRLRQREIEEQIHSITFAFAGQEQLFNTNNEMPQRRGVSEDIRSTFFRSRYHSSRKQDYDQHT